MNIETNEELKCIRNDIDLMKDTLKVILRIDSLTLAHLSSSQNFSPDLRIQVIDLLKNVTDIINKMENKKDGIKNHS